jgi:predicted cupin superfamily sugar epimerase
MRNGQSMMNKRAQKLIHLLKLTPHPEGGYYRETYRSEKQVKSPQNGQLRDAVTDIYFLLVAGQISRFHQVLHDEIWHFYEGDPLELVELKSANLEITKTVLGGGKDQVNYKHCIKGGNWQAAHSLGEYSLAGCTVAPGFDFSDFTLLKDDWDLSSAVLKKYPELSHLV